jgi:hypothetical protein
LPQPIDPAARHDRIPAGYVSGARFRDAEDRASTPLDFTRYASHAATKTISRTASYRALKPMDEDNFGAISKNVGLAGRASASFGWFVGSNRQPCGRPTSPGRPRNLGSDRIRLQRRRNDPFLLRPRPAPATLHQRNNLNRLHHRTSQKYLKFQHQPMCVN